MGGCVSLPIEASAVVGEAVELHDESMGRPERVDLMSSSLPIEQDVEPRRGQAGCTDELLMTVLQLTARVSWLPRGYRPSQQRGTRAPPRIGKKALDGMQVEPLQALRPVDGAFDLSV
jgi:hypothetical protein